MAYETNYDWAVNKSKLQYAIADLIARQKVDPQTVIDEESIKARYEARGGLVKVITDSVIPGMETETTTTTRKKSTKSDEATG